MKLKAWLKKEKKKQRWLARTLGVSDAMVSQALSGRRTIPHKWIPQILLITQGEVGVYDEWAPGKTCKEPSRAGRKKEICTQPEADLSGENEEESRGSSTKRASKRINTGLDDQENISKKEVA